MREINQDFVRELMKKSLKELRKYQTINDKLAEGAFKSRATKTLEELNVRSDEIMLAIDKKCFRD
jgi:hypothetical protein